MEPLILNGKETQQYFLNKLPSMTKECQLLIITIGGAGYANEKYINNKIKACQSKNITAIRIDYPAKDNDDEYNKTIYNKIVKDIQCYNWTKSCCGIIIQKPYPVFFNGIENYISPSKDVDCATDKNYSNLLAKLPYEFVPATPMGIMMLLNHYNINLEGKNVVVIGRSKLVGRPLATMLDNMNATVTLCHSKTKELWNITCHADIIVSAIGKPKYINESFLSYEDILGNKIYNYPIIIDVGINKDDNDKLCGDVDFNNTYPYCSAITKVPGGVGPMTILALLLNIYKAAGYDLTEYFSPNELYI